MNYEITRLSIAEVDTLKKLLTVFRESFDDTDAHTKEVPDDSYLTVLLAKPDFYAVVAVREGEVLGGVTGYELMLPTRKAKELYLYDLAVDAAYRRQGIGRALIEGLTAIAKENQIALMFVEAESSDTEAVRFYESLGAEQLSVEHFNIVIT